MRGPTTHHGLKGTAKLLLTEHHAPGPTACSQHAPSPSPIHYGQTGLPCSPRSPDTVQAGNDLWQKKATGLLGRDRETPLSWP